MTGAWWVHDRLEVALYLDRRCWHFGRGAVRIRNIGNLFRYLSIGPLELRLWP